MVVFQYERAWFFVLVLFGALLESLANNHDRSLPYSAKVPCSSRGWGRRSGKTTALYEEDDDVHDDLYGIHVL